MPGTAFALSLKQPWAALVVHGHKTIEVRRWPTARLGRVLIHAARVPDHRPAAWSRLPDGIIRTARLVGGIIGTGELTGCKRYRDRAEFEADCPAHLNDPSWFEEPGLYGFVLANAAVVPFRPYSGAVRFFRVEDPPPESPD